MHLCEVTSSRSCANFGLLKTAQDHEREFDVETASTVSRDLYVDNFLKSVATFGKAITYANQLRTMPAKGGFQLFKCASNSREVLTSIPPRERASSLVDLNFECFSLSVALVVM